MEQYSIQRYTPDEFINLTNTDENQNVFDEHAFLRHQTILESHFVLAAVNHNNKIMGFSRVELLKKENAYALCPRTTSVAEPYRRQKIGQNLLKICFNIAKNNNLDILIGELTGEGRDLVNSLKNDIENTYKNVKIHHGNDEIELVKNPEFTIHYNT